MSESLRNDGRVWVPKYGDDIGKAPGDIPEEERDYYLERRYPAFGNLVPRDVASRAAKAVCDEGRGVGSTGLGVYLDFEEAVGRLGKQAVSERYGNLFDMYHHITDEDPYAVPMRIFPAVHYTMGGLWVDYNLMSNLPGLFVLGEANFSDHGANRLGASALMQGLADGYFVAPSTVANYLATVTPGAVDKGDEGVKEARATVKERVSKLLNVGGKRSPDSFHRELGLLCWDKCGMARSESGLKDALVKIPARAGGVLGKRSRHGYGRTVQPRAREGWARGGLPRVRRVDGPRCTQSGRIVRGSFSRGTCHRRRRGQAQRRRLLLRRGVGAWRRWQ